MTEKLPTSNRDGRVSRLDHEVACLNILDTTFDDPERTRNHLAGMIQEQIQIDREPYNKLLLIGTYLIPKNSEDGTGLSSDHTMHEVYATSITMALATLDALCEQLDIDVDMFRRAWTKNGLVSLADFSGPKYAHMTDAEMHNQTGSGIVKLGNRSLDELGDVYEPVVERIGELNDAAALNPNIARGSYGYVLGAGINTLNRILHELHVRELTQAMNDGSTVQDWGVEADIREIDRSTKFQRLADHAATADAIDTQAFFVDKSSEKYFIRLIDDCAQHDEALASILDTLALVSYPNELGNGALDDEGDAFFNGTLLGLEVAKVYAAQYEVAEADMLRAWRKHRMQKKLWEMKFLPEDFSMEFDEYVSKAVTRQEIPTEYQWILDKLSHSEGHSEQAAIAFRRGFSFMLCTASDGVKSRVDAAISQEVKHEMDTFDDELLKLLDGPLE